MIRVSCRRCLYHSVQIPVGYKLYGEPGKAACHWPANPRQGTKRYTWRWSQQLPYKPCSSLMRLVTCWYGARHLLSLFPPPPPFLWIPVIPLPQRGRERVLCVPGTQLFFPPLWNLIQKSHAIKMSLFAILFFFFFLNAIPNSKIFIHSLVSRRKETTKQCTRGRSNEAGDTLNEPEPEDLWLWLL